MRYSSDIHSPVTQTGSKTMRNLSYILAACVGSFAAGSLSAGDSASPPRKAQEPLQITLHPMAELRPA